MSVNESFGQVLRRLRKERGLRQQEAADKIGIHHTYLSKLESDRVGPPRNPTILRLAGVYGINADYLMVKAGRIPAAMQKGVTETLLREVRP